MTVFELEAIYAKLPAEEAAALRAHVEDLETAYRIAYAPRGTGVIITSVTPGAGGGPIKVSAGSGGSAGQSDDFAKGGNGSSR